MNFSWQQSKYMAIWVWILYVQQSEIFVTCLLLAKLKIIRLAIPATNVLVEHDFIPNTESKLLKKSIKGI